MKDVKDFLEVLAHFTLLKSPDITKAIILHITEKPRTETELVKLLEGKVTRQTVQRHLERYQDLEIICKEWVPGSRYDHYILCPQLFKKLKKFQLSYKKMRDHHKTAHKR